MDNELLDLDWQKSAAIKSMLDSQGWKIYVDKIQSMYDSVVCDIENQTNGFLNQEGLNRLNYLLARKNTLNQILLLKEELLDEIDNTSPQDEGFGA